MSQGDQNARVVSDMDQPFGLCAHQGPSHQLPVTFNAGKCTHYTLLRREAGVTGHALSPNWYQAHQSTHGAGLPAPRKTQAYAPTTLLKVPGPEQMKQEWIAAKGTKAYAREMRYLKAYAQARHAPLAAYQAGEVE